MASYERSLRPVLRQLLIRTVPACASVSSVTVVSGLPRSGTSWLAKTLSLGDGVAYYFEPDQHIEEGDFYIGRRSGCVDRALAERVESILTGRIVTEPVICEWGIKDILLRATRGTVLVKLVRMVFSLNWLADNFPYIRVVQIVRHPVPQFLSWRQRGWDPQYQLTRLLGGNWDSELDTGKYAGMAEAAGRHDAFWGCAAVLWCMAAEAQMNAHRAGWLLKEHEWICQDPEARMLEIAGATGIEWNERMAEFLSPARKRKTGPGYGGKRDPRSEIRKWIDQISRRELNVVNSVLRESALPFYHNLDPEAFWEA